MSRLTGIILILSGLAVGAYSMPSDGEPAISALQAVIGSGRESGHAAGPQQRVAASLPVSRTAAAIRRAEPAPTPVVVTVPPRPSEPSTSPSISAAIPTDRDTLARELQRELRRVGCYEAEVNGQWTPATRRAMKAFIDRVNATLPVGEPDPVLLVMVRGHEDDVCSKACPPGQGVAGDGRCVPNALLARAGRRAPVVVGQQRRERPAPAVRQTSAVASWSARVSSAPSAGVGALPAVSQMPAEERMGLAGPTAEPTLPAISGMPGAAKRHARPRHATRTPSRRNAGPSRQSTFARVVFRRVDSAF